MIDMYIHTYIYPKYGLIQTLRFNRQTCGIVGIEWDFFYGTIMDKKTSRPTSQKSQRNGGDLYPEKLGYKAYS